MPCRLPDLKNARLASRFPARCARGDRGQLWPKPLSQGLSASAKLCHARVSAATTMAELEPITPTEAKEMFLAHRRAEVAEATLQGYHYRLKPFDESSRD